jgi:hypothetical protein
MTFLYLGLKSIISNFDLSAEVTLFTIISLNRLTKAEIHLSKFEIQYSTAQQANPKSDLPATQAGIRNPHL